MKIQLLRHAAMLITLNGQKLLVDPMLTEAGTAEPIKTRGNSYRNPLVELPLDRNDLQTLLHSIDAVILTHTHFDHFDETAAQLLPKDTPVLCQPVDEEKMKSFGFHEVIPIHAFLEWEGISITRTGGRHGKGLIGKAMGCVSGYVLKVSGEPTLYIAGDTIWCREVKQALQAYKPDVAVVFAGAAQFDKGSPITMTAADVEKVCRECPDTRVVAVHMEAINHCLLTRSALSEFLSERNLEGQVSIPQNGETLEFI
jgi:L-ascorbate metabolism protein UlaG (beta-lactamase superfamily)